MISLLLSVVGWIMLLYLLARVIGLAICAVVWFADNMRSLITGLPSLYRAWRDAHRPR